MAREEGVPMTRPLEEVLAVPEGVTETPWHWRREPGPTRLEGPSNRPVLHGALSPFGQPFVNGLLDDRDHIVRCVNLYPLLVAVAVAGQKYRDGTLDGCYFDAALSALRSAAEGRGEGE